MMQPAANDKPARRRKARRTLALLALICTAPVVASYFAYYWWRPEARTNYGELLEPGAVPRIAGARLDGTPFQLSELQGRWVLLLAETASCESRCERALYATRQARTIQGREQDRVVRALLLPTDAPAPSMELLSSHPGIIVVRGDSRQWQSLPGNAAGARVYLVDPHGNLVLRYSADPDMRGLAKDLERLLRASRIG